MTLDDETAANLAREVVDGGKASRVYPHSTDVALVRAGYAARDAEVEELRAERDAAWAGSNARLDAALVWESRAEKAEATLAKVRERVRGYLDMRMDAGAHMVAREVLAILDESPTERETPTGEWEYGHEYTHMDGSPYRRRVSDEVFREHAPDGHRADGSPYWNYRQLRRRKSGPWEVVPDDRA